jgi:hypothetical protein
MVVGMLGMILNETAATIGTIGLAGNADREIDQGMAKRAAAAIAADGGCFDMNDFGWLHTPALSNRDMADGSGNRPIPRGEVTKDEARSTATSD